MILASESRFYANEQMWTVYMLLLLLVCGTHIVFGDEDWHDPTDMINYDLASGTMRNRETPAKETTHTEPVCEGVSSEVYELCESNVTELKSQVSHLNDSVTTLSRQVSRCSSIHQEVFFHQYIRTLLKQLPKLESPETEGDHYQVDVRMSPTQFKYLKDYVNQRQNSTAEVHSILSEMLHNLRWVAFFEDVVVESSLLQKSKEWLWISTQVVALISCICWLSVYVPRSAWWISTRLVTASFIVSIPWNWWHLYKKAIAKNHAELLRSMPDSCKPGHTSLWSFLTSWMWNRNSECVRYSEAVEIDPLWEVPPTKAIAVTFVKFFLEPAGHIGEALNRLVTAAFDDLPFYLWLPVFSLLVFLIVLLMFFMFGYRVRGLFWNIEPHRPVEPLCERVQQLEREKEVVERENQALQRQLADQQHDYTEQRAHLNDLQRQNTLLYNQLPALRSDRPGLRSDQPGLRGDRPGLRGSEQPGQHGEGDCQVVKTLDQPVSIVSLHSDCRREVPVEETGCTVVASQAQLEHDYEFIDQQ